MSSSAPQQPQPGMLIDVDGGHEPGDDDDVSSVTLDRKAFGAKALAEAKKQEKHDQDNIQNDQDSHNQERRYNDDSLDDHWQQNPLSRDRSGTESHDEVERVSGLDDDLDNGANDEFYGGSRQSSRHDDSPHRSRDSYYSQQSHSQHSGSYQSNSQHSRSRHSSGPHHRSKSPDSSFDKKNRPSDFNDSLYDINIDDDDDDEEGQRHMPGDPPVKPKSTSSYMQRSYQDDDVSWDDDDDLSSYKSDPSLKKPQRDNSRDGSGGWKNKTSSSNSKAYSDDEDDPLLENPRGSRSHQRGESQSRDSYMSSSGHDQRGGSRSRDSHVSSRHEQRRVMVMQHPGDPPVKPTKQLLDDESTDFDEENDSYYDDDNQDLSGYQHPGDPPKKTWMSSLRSLGSRSRNSHSSKQRQQQQQRQQALLLQQAPPPPPPPPQQQQQQQQRWQHLNDNVYRTENGDQIKQQQQQQRQQQQQQEDDASLSLGYLSKRPKEDSFGDANVMELGAASQPTVRQEDHREASMAELRKSLGKTEQKGTERKRQAVHFLSFLFLLGMGGLAYWLFTIARFSLDDVPRGDYQGVIPNITFQGPTSVPDSNQSATPPPTIMVESVPFPPSDFTQKCDPDIIASSPLALLECEGLCRRAECCYVPPSPPAINASLDDATMPPPFMFAKDACYNVSDTNNNTAACNAYSPLCDFIYGSLQGLPKLIQAPPSDLTDTCSLAGVSTAEGGKTCINACYEGFCCFSSYATILASGGTATSQPSCFEENREICQSGYAPCVVALVAQIEGILPDSPNNESQTPDDAMPDPPAGLDQACSPDSIDTQGGFVQCMSGCLPALCCLDTNPATSCFAANGEYCTQYLSCQTLLSRLNPENDMNNNNDTIVVESPENNNGTMAGPQNETNSTSATPLMPPIATIQEVCSLESVATLSGFANCLIQCRPAECCTAAPENSCFGAYPLTCILYAPCQNLQNVMSNNDTNATDILSMTPSISLAPSPPTNASTAPSTTLTPSTTPSITGSSAPSSNTMRLAIPAGLQEACSEESVVTESGLNECVEKCAPAECCDATTNSCFDDNILACLFYAPCRILEALAGIVVPTALPMPSAPPSRTPLEPAPSNLASICAIPNLSFLDFFQLCANICAAADCCTTLDTTQNCYDDNAAVCDGYASCLNLVEIVSRGEAPPTTNDDNDSNTPTQAPFSSPLAASAAETADGIMEACSESSIESDDLSACQQLCYQGLCCFLDDNEAGSCAQNTDICAPYMPCSVLLDATQSEVSNNDTLRNACRDEVVGTSEAAYGKCAALCMEGSCCFAQGQISNVGCDSDCDYYEPCRSFFVELQQGPVPSNKPSISPALFLDPITIERNCETASLQTEEGRQECTNLCGLGACCFLEPSVDDSCSQDVVFCGIFGPCANLAAAAVDEPPPLEIEPEPVTDVEDLPTHCDLTVEMDEDDLMKCFEACEAFSCCHNEEECPTDVDHAMCTKMNDVCGAIINMG